MSGETNISMETNEIKRVKVFETWPDLYFTLDLFIGF